MILLISNQSEAIGGGEISLLLLIEGLLEQGDFDLTLAVPASGAVGERAASMGVEIVELPLPRLRRNPWRLRRATRQAARVVERVAPVLVHANGTRAMVLAGRAGQRLKLPVVWHVRVQPGDRLDGWLSRHASAIIAPSRVVARRFPSREVDVIPNPVKLPPAPAGDAAGASASISDTSEFVILVATRLSPDRGHLRIFEALRLLPPDIPWRLVVAGGEDPDHPDFAAQLREIVRREGWRDGVEFIGFRWDLPNLMRQTDLLVHAPETEGFGRIFVEAMAVGLPVVVTPAGGLEEIHEDTGYGWMSQDFSPAALAAALQRAIESQRERHECLAKGPPIVRSSYSLGAHADAIASVYRRLLVE